MKTAIISSKTSSNHLTGDGHPEQPKRVEAIIDRLKKNKKLMWGKPKIFDPNILKETHDENYINLVKKSFPDKGIKFLDGDTIVSTGSKDATIDAVGSVLEAVDGVEKKNSKMLFVQFDLLDIMLKKIKQWVFAYIIIVRLLQIILLKNIIIKK